MGDDTWAIFIFDFAQQIVFCFSVAISRSSEALLVLWVQCVPATPPPGTEQMGLLGIVLES